LGIYETEADHQQLTLDPQFEEMVGELSVKAEMMVQSQMETDEIPLVKLRVGGFDQGETQPPLIHALKLEVMGSNLTLILPIEMMETLFLEMGVIRLEL
jgi:hypothetical protein